MYEAHKWKIGEEITSEKLNHIEKGIEEAGLPREITDPQDGQTLKYDAASGKWVNGEGGGSAAPMVIHIAGDPATMDKTAAEIKAAYPNIVVEATESNHGITTHTIYPLTKITFAEGTEGVMVFIDSDIYSTHTDAGYPVEAGDPS